MRRLLIASAVLAVAAVPAAAAQAKVPKGPAGIAFYTPPAPLPGSGHGGLIRARKLTGDGVLGNASRNQLLLYRSVGVDGEPIAVSGTVAVPKGKAPRGGWPIITYAHGTTGIADACAPTLDKNGTSVHTLNSYAYPLLERWLKAGYAVVRTDYEGLGTPGAHPYLVGRSEGYSVLDAARAARRFMPRLSKKTIIAGHSQGGHAALWAASLERSWTPELKVRGTVAFAPASHIADQGRLLRNLTTPSGLSGLAAMIIRGLDTGNPGLIQTTDLGDRAAALYPDSLTECLPDLSQTDSFGGLAPADIFRSDVNLDPFIAALAANDPEHLAISTPVRIDQGTADGTVFQTFTDRLAEDYRGRNVKLTYKTYEGVSHGGVVTSAARNATRWIRGKLRG